MSQSAPKSDFIIAEESPLSDDARALVRALDQDMRDRYPPEACHLTSVEDLAEEAVFFMVRDGKQAIACAAMRPLDAPGVMEIKRMFVDEHHRGRGIAMALMDRIEREAITRGASCLMLETGEKQPEAISLYKRLGFSLRGPYADYPDHPLSTFMEKRLS